MTSTPHATTPDVPKWTTLFWPTLQALIELGGSGRVQEIEAKAAERIRASEAVQSVLHGQGPYTELNYRLAWCRTYLKGVGYLTNSGRGVWSITDEGRKAAPADMATVVTRYRGLHRAPKIAAPGSEEPPAPE